MRAKVYSFTKYICDTCNTEYDEVDEVLVCKLCNKDICDNINCQLNECCVIECKAKICDNCSKIDSVTHEVACNICFIKYNRKEARLD